MKITLVGFRDYSFTGNNGEEVSGRMYYGFPEKGKPIEFSSTGEHEVYEGQTSFSSGKCEEISIEPNGISVRTGMVRWREKSVS